MIKLCNNLGPRFISWDSAADGVREGYDNVVERFLNHHAVDEEGIYETKDGYRYSGKLHN